jgi:hypothetical protein
MEVNAMGEERTLTYRIEDNNGNGWYWELIASDRAVIARGLADTQQQARAAAAKAGTMPLDGEPAFINGV